MNITYADNPCLKVELSTEEEDYYGFYHVYGNTLAETNEQISTIIAEYEHTYNLIILYNKPLKLLYKPNGIFYYMNTVFLMHKKVKKVLPIEVNPKRRRKTIKKR
jgi:hypothetical protein